MKVKITHLIDPVFYQTTVQGIEGLIPRGAMAAIGCALRSAIRGALSLVIEHKREFAFLDTDIPLGVPPIVQHHTASLCSHFERYAANMQLYFGRFEQDQVGLQSFYLDESN